MTRPLDLIGCECWDVGERIMLPKKFNDLLGFDPLFFYKPGRAVTVYYNFTDPNQDLRPLLAYLEKNIPWFLKIKKEFDKDCEQIRKMIYELSDDYKNLYELISVVWPVIAVANIYGSLEVYDVSKELRDVCIRIRRESDDILHPATAYLSKIVSRKLNLNLGIPLEHSKYISMSEFLDDRIPDNGELLKRAKGYLYHKGKLFLNAKKYILENNAYLNEDKTENDKKEIHGQIACKCIARGKTKIVFEISDLEKIEDGDVLVAPMTTPEMIMAMKKAVAFVTDEGGITCHAAIVARELGKPCIIGTKIATQFLKDGDMVEVDAEKGIVKILK